MDMMNDMVKMVATKAGISEAQAKSAVDAVMDHLMKMMPGPMAEQMKGMMTGGGMGGMMDAAKGMLGGMGEKK